MSPAPAMTTRHWIGYAVGGAVALAMHGGLIVTLGMVSPSAWASHVTPPVELEVIEQPPPPPPPPPEPPPPEPPAPKPRVVVHRMAPKPPPEAPKPEPPPPNEPPPPEPVDPSPPVFGVTLDSTVTGESSVAVPVGNTTMTPDRGPPKPPAPLPAAEGPPAFEPVPESFIAEHPRLLHEVKEKAPDEADRLGIEGQVVLKVGIDRRGAIRSVRVIKPAGYGFDEVATRAMWKFKFTPARTNDGRAVDFLITYKYTFMARR
jgi:periplasmic protein TonB